MTALLFGSISTLADTSELQRQAFNDAFAAHDLDWHWGQDEYRELLRSAGGARRISEYAAERGDSVDADAVHATKSEKFRDALKGGGGTARPGVRETIDAARAHGVKVAVVTTTAPDNVAAVLDAIGVSDVDLVVDASTVTEPKPDPAAYRHALEALGEAPDSAVAVEDNEDGVRAGLAGGLRVYAFPNENTRGHDFASATATLDALSFDALGPIEAHPGAAA